MRRVEIKVIPNAPKERIVAVEGRLRVYVTAPAVDGKANKAVVEVLSKYFGLKKKDVLIVKGEKSREKVVGLE